MGFIQPNTYALCSSVILVCSFLFCDIISFFVVSGWWWLHGVCLGVFIPVQFLEKFRQNRYLTLLWIFDRNSPSQTSGPGLLFFGSFVAFSISVLVFFLLLLISSLIALWSEKMLEIICFCFFFFFNLPRLDLWRKMWSILESVACALEENVYSASWGGMSYKYQLSLCGLVCHLKPLFPCLLYAGWSVCHISGMLKFSPHCWVVVDFSFHGC